ncbi:ABC transporter permease [Actinokineospora xionganensis]|uniref:ABC transporter permease n=1 Tax=Actinokineospora xionganensis TaxID=2684470 RepID=A0ABR7KZT9_9PSEU|nr:ABC transporter permease [Actinokineospora xionganensis]MBC6445949.1 ABC transporter permease [Actinokineospora xionganensis]
MNSYVWAQLRSRRRRSVAVVAGVAFGAALYVAISILGAGFQTASRAPLESVGADLVLTRPGAAAENSSVRGIRTPDGLATFADDDLKTVEGVDRVDGASGAVQLWEFGARETVTIVGVDGAERAVGPGKLLRDDMTEGRAFSAGERGIAVADLHYARFYDLQVGSTATIGGRKFEIVGILEVANGSQAASANMFIPIDDAREIAGMAPGTVNQIHVKLSDASQTDAVVAALNGKLGQVSAITEDSMVQVFGAVGRISAKFSAIAAAIAVLGGVMLSWLALQGMVNERSREIGLLKAVGWRRRDVVRVISLEALVLSVVGAVVGIALGTAVAGLLADIPLPATQPLPMQGAGHSGMPTDDAGATASDVPTLPVRIDALTLLAASAASIIAGTVAGWATAHRAAKIKAAHNLTAL